jgi:protein-S-isoprenylcysteine O-methyltransferase Ste14
MTPIPFDALPARIVFGALLVIYVVVEAGIRIASQRNAGGAPARERASYWILIIVLLGSMAAALYVAQSGAFAIPAGRWALFVAGVVVMALGIALRVWAVVVLGRAFTVEVRVRDGQEVVDRGPYRAVRHPSYTGLLLVFLGTGLALGDWLALILVVVPPVAAVVFRIRVEEAALLAGLGEAYRRYSAGRKRLIPGIW